jgi:hypothetical protein
MAYQVPHHIYDSYSGSHYTLHSVLILAVDPGWARVFPHVVLRAYRANVTIGAFRESGLPQMAGAAARAICVRCSFLSSDHTITQIFTNLSLRKKALPKKQVFNKTFLKSFGVFRTSASPRNAHLRSPFRYDFIKNSEFTFFLPQYPA